MGKQLNLFNTASGKKEPFIPSHEQVGMYCCGPTVYNYAHIGNLRTYVFEDVLKRALVFLGYAVRHVMNITDVGHLTSDADTGEDKMEKGALREGKNVRDIAAFYTEAFKKNMKELNIVPPDVWPKATDHIPQMIAMVEELESKGFTYTTGDGIYFDTAKFPAYADFARIDIESLHAGSRVDMGEKRRATDFALWKFSPVDKQRQMEWESPWGKGFPGWHIECSAMALAYLPQPIDIHCGGMDHVRVHHTNEIAQTEAATGKRFVRYWLHGEFLIIDKEKMAKSGEHFVTLDSVKKEGIHPLAYRMFCFSAHYRSPLMFSWKGIKSAQHGLLNLKSLIAAETKRPSGEARVFPGLVEPTLGPFWAALCDDCNMPMAMAALWNLLRDGSISAEEKYCAVEHADSVLGLDLLAADAARSFMKEMNDGDLRVKLIARSDPGQEVTGRIMAMARQRKEAKKSKDFGKADEIRKQLNKMGVEVKDLPGAIMECMLKGD